MKFTGTFNELFLFRKDIENQKANHPTFGIFHKAKIIDFYSRNKLRLDQMDGRIRFLLKKHAELDDQGEIKRDDDNKIIYKSEEDKESFTHDYNLFMMTNINLDW